MAWYYVVYHSPTQLYLTDVSGQTAVSYAGISDNIRRLADAHDL